MPGFIYFVSGKAPHDKRAEQEAVEQFTSAGFVRGGHVRGTKRGPDDNYGYLINGPGSKKLPNLTDDQTWRQCPWDKDIWIGYEERPTPDDLARPIMLPGETIELEGQQWLIPSARSWEEDADGQVGWVTTLPVVADLDECGEWTEQNVVEKHRKLSDYAWKFIEYLSRAVKEVDPNAAGEIELNFNFAARNDACVEALATNYYVGKLEVATLGLLNDQTRSLVLASICSLKRLNKILEKKSAEPPVTSTDGKQDCTPAIAQQ